MSWLASAITGGSGILSGIVGGLFANNQAKKQYQYNSKLMDQQNAYNVAMYDRESTDQYNMQDIANKFSSSERQAQNEWNENQYLQYNSPEAMVRQYTAAGLNPQLAAGQTGTASVSGSAPQGAPASAPNALPLQMPFQQVTPATVGFRDMAAGLASLGEAAAKGIDVSFMTRRYKEQIKGMELSNIAQEFANSINFKYLDQKEFLQVAQLFKTLSKTDLEMDELRETIGILKGKRLITDKEAEKWLERFTKEIEKADSEIKANEASANSLNADVGLKESETDLNFERATSEIYRRALYKAQSSYYRALDDLTKSQKLTEDERKKLVQAQSKVQDCLGDIMSIELSERRQITEDKVKALLAKYKMTPKECELMLRQLEAVTEQEEFRNNTKEVSYAMDRIEQVSDIVSSWIPSPFGSKSPKVGFR